MKVGDLVRTRKGNLAIVLDRVLIANILYIDLRFLKTGLVRTGFSAWQCEVISASR
jgi:hypothetical protein